MDQRTFQNPELMSAIRAGLELQQEIRTWEASAPEALERLVQEVNWRDVSSAFQRLTTDPVKAEMAPALVNAVRVQARFKPPAMVIAELLSTAMVLMDESFQPALQAEEDPMD